METESKRSTSEQLSDTAFELDFLLGYIGEDADVIDNILEAHPCPEIPKEVQTLLGLVSRDLRSLSEKHGALYFPLINLSNELK